MTRAAPAIEPLLDDAGLDALVALLRGRRIAVLTGAGCSTESGIPDYRGAGTRARARSPIQYRAFLSDHAARQRYWARALVGWRRFANKLPNPAHHALAALGRAGKLSGLVTQNVDRLHQAAGSDGVVELHGAIAEVVCLGCRDVSSRADFQARLEESNPTFAQLSAPMAPDADADLEVATQAFEVPACARCGGVIKPHVVFFGESVPKERVEAAWQIVHRGEVLLVIGSSLAVYSGYRFVRGAKERAQPVAILNLGTSRGDPHATVRVAAKAGELLPALVERLV